MLGNDIIAKLKNIYPSEFEKIQKAFDLAESAHSGQKRASGDPYVVHPTEVANILADLGLDADTICAAFLHDVLEDTPLKADIIEQEFGSNILELVEGVTKLDKIVFESKEDEQAENFRKMFFAMAKDIRILLIKLADRLHNMRTVFALSEDRKRAMANETLEIYAPLASFLGLSYIKCELEDLCLKVLHPDIYQNICDEINCKKEERQALVDRICDELKSMLGELEVVGEVSGRPKHIYSIYKKMTGQKKQFSQIYDLTAVRVIVQTVINCYEVLGKIHTVWKPIPGRFKDYIAVPKPNKYQSLHTTVMTNYGSPFEIQIRTQEMHKIAEYGIAAHWIYKEKRSGLTEFDKNLSWLRSTIDSQKENVSDSKEFLESLKIDLYSGQVFVFTPKGDVLILPEGSTPVDFAYTIHSNVGNKCVSAKIDNKLVPLATKLVTGNYVEIITSNNSKGPSRDWLKFVKTSSAKNKIRTFFKKTMHEDNIKIGKDMIEAEIKRKGFTPQQLFLPKWLDPILNRFNLTSMDDMYSAVGYGGVSTGQILLKLIDKYKKEQEALKPPKPMSVTKIKEQNNGIIVKGFSDLPIKLARCCTPVPGDPIIGFVSRGRGISVHRASCTNLKGLESERLIETEWSKDAHNFCARLQIIAVDTQGLLSKITILLSELKVGISSLNARVSKNKDAIIDLNVLVEKLSDIDLVIKKLEMMKDIKHASRL